MGKNVTVLFSRARVKGYVTLGELEGSFYSIQFANSMLNLYIELEAKTKSNVKTWNFQSNVKN